MSHPTWVRGLKQQNAVNANDGASSHPTWVRGLKLILMILLMSLLSRTLRGCVD